MGGCIRRSRAAIEQGNLAEDLPLADDIQNGAASLDGRDAHLHRPAGDCKQAVAGVTFGEDRGATLEISGTGIAAQLVERRRLEFAKEMVFA